jgi:SAM-dependent methyltransferase
MYTWFERLRSLRHRFWYGVSERLRWSRGVFYETPAHALGASDPQQAQRIAALQSRYQVKFEEGLSAATSYNNYEYLDILDRAWSASELALPAGGELCDVGCANFWYAEALQAFFRPSRMVGVEVEGYRLYRDGHTRIDYAAGYLARVPNAKFLIADYGSCELPADLITAWFPFVTARAILAWRLPLRLLDPARLFERVRVNLRPDGLFVMVNHGPHEAGIAAGLCGAAGLNRVCEMHAIGALSGHRLEAASFSCWRR